MKRLSLLIVGLIVLLGGGYWFYTAQVEDGNEVTLSSSNELTEEDSAPESSVEEIKESQESTETTSRESSSQEENLPEQPPTPNIEMMTVEGESVYLQDLLADNKPMIINLWASWCPPCKEEMPIFEAYAKEYSDEIRFIMLNATESRPTETVETALSYLEEEGLDLPVYFDVDFNSQIAFGARTLPTTIVIDSQGDVIVYYPGQVTQATMDQFISYLD